MSFVRDVISETVRALGTSVPEDKVSVIEQSVMQSLRLTYGGETARVYVPKIGTSERAVRARRIRALFNGRNGAALAAQFGVSERTVQRYVGRRRPGSD